MTTKEQERKALAQIKKIVEGLGGEESYLGITFKGCFEMAEDNIENDFGNCMMEQRDAATKREFEAQKRVDGLNGEIETMRKNNEMLQNELSEMNTCSDRLRKSLKEANDMAVENWNKFREQEDKVEALQMEIMKLKARLFDMMEAQGA